MISTYDKEAIANLLRGVIADLEIFSKKFRVLSVHEGSCEQHANHAATRAAQVQQTLDELMGNKEYFFVHLDGTVERRMSYPNRSVIVPTISDRYLVEHMYVREQLSAPNSTTSTYFYRHHELPLSDALNYLLDPRLHSNPNSK